MEMEMVMMMVKMELVMMIVMMIKVLVMLMASISQHSEGKDPGKSALRERKARLYVSSLKLTVRKS